MTAIFKFITCIKIIFISIQFSLKCVAEGPINNDLVPNRQLGIIWTNDGRVTGIYKSPGLDDLVYIIWRLKNQIACLYNQIDSTPEEHELTIVAATFPTICADITSMDSPASYGVYRLCNRHHPMQLYCHDLAGNPKTYISLRDPENNYGENYNTGARTKFSRVAVDLQVNLQKIYQYQ